MTIQRNLNTYRVLTGLMILVCFSCKKLVSIPEPVDTMTTVKLFTTDGQANSAMVGVYGQLINGIDNSAADGQSGFSYGLSTLTAGSSADELVGRYLENNANKLISVDPSSLALWKSAYQGIYGANAVIEGIEASTSPSLHDNVRNSLTGEAKFVRAFCYFYLVNFFGDVPLALTVDFNQTANMSRTPKAEVYAQIVKDLLDAKAKLPADFSSSKTGERIRANKWAATALLARVYLYTGNYAEAAAQSGEVIGQTGLFQLKTDLNDVFLKNSSEAIWQLQQSNKDSFRGNATPEGASLLVDISQTKVYPFVLSDELVPLFEDQDKRKKAWLITSGAEGKIYYTPYKYKIGKMNSSFQGEITEYYMALRFAEQYLIRAEARVLANQSLDLAIADLNVIRHRAGVNDLPSTLSRAEVISAVERERRLELFAEWGHRWFDLKRTGRAHDVLSVIPRKQPWSGDYQLLYPIPPVEILNNHNLIQNTGY